jgi:hypothetical protein
MGEKHYLLGPKIGLPELYATITFIRIVSFV